MPCKKHPYFSSVGICSYCLNDRLMNLVCSACGEQRFSSCSCSDISSSCTGDIGSVGRISFLLENENERKKEVVFRRSSSSCVEIKKSRNGFWKIKRLFVRNKKEKGSEKDGKIDQKVEKKSVSRSRSLCSFRGGGSLSNDADEGSDYAFQSAKISDVTGGVMFNDFESRKSGFAFRGFFSDVDSEPRNSGSRYLFDSENEQKKSGFRGFFDSDNEPRKNGFRGLFDAENEARKSVFRGLFDGENDPRKSGFIGLFDAENEPRKSGLRGIYDSVENGVNSLKVVRKMGGPGELNRVNSVPNRSIFPVKETEFSAINGDDDEDPAFINVKIDQLPFSKSKREFSFAASSDHKYGNLMKEVGESNRILSSSSVGGSCRRIGNDEELKKGGRGSNSKGWKWIFFRQNSGRRSTSK
ncbi:hypothetical protein Leryth_019440 [Lithospermum erythrorhizon]|nr:hypothetical protein Leryth_019440 [Lithospermum erythrorhizon]